MEEYFGVEKIKSVCRLGEKERFRKDNQTLEEVQRKMRTFGGTAFRNEKGQGALTQKGGWEERAPCSFGK